MRRNGRIPAAVVTGVCMAAFAVYPGENGKDVAEAYLLDFAETVNCVFLGVVEDGGVNRAVLRVERPFTGIRAGEKVVVAGFNTVEVNSSHYRLEKGMRRLVMGFRSGEEVWVPSPYSGCFPVDDGRVVLFPYRGASPVAVPEEMLRKVLTAFYSPGGAFEKVLADALYSPAVEERYMALVFGAFSESRDLRDEIRRYEEDDNPVLREAAAVALASSALDAAGMPDLSRLDAPGVVAVWGVLRKRLAGLFGRDMGGWVKTAAEYVGAAEEFYSKGEDLPSEVRDALSGVVDEGVEFLWLAAPFGTDGVGELLAYPRLRTAVLQVLAVSSDERRLPLVAAFLSDPDPTVAASASAAVRRLTGDVTSVFPAVSAKGRWRSIRGLEARPEDLRRAFAPLVVYCGDYALFRLGEVGLLAGGDFPEGRSVYWRDVAFPSAVPEVMLLPVGAALEERLGFFEAAVPLCRRFPESAPLLEYWIRIFGEFGGAFEKEAAVRAAAALPDVPEEVLEILKAALVCEDSVDVRKAAFDTARRLGLPLFSYRYSEEPALEKSVAERAGRFWKPVKRSFTPSRLPWEEAPAEKDASYARFGEMLLNPRAAAAVLAGPPDDRSALFAAAGTVLARLRGKVPAQVPDPGNLPPIPRAILAAYGLGGEDLGKAGTGRAGALGRRARLFGAANKPDETGDLSGTDLALAVLGAAGRGDSPLAWSLAVANRSGFDDTNYMLLAGCLKTPRILREARGFISGLSEWLKGDGEYATIVAAEVLARLGGEVEREAVLKLLASDNPSLQAAGCRLAGISGDELFLLPLGEIARGTDPFLQLKAAEAICRIGGPKAVRLLVSARNGAADEAVKALLLEYVVGADDAGFEEARKVLAGSDWTARYYAVLGLGKARYRRAKEELLSLWLDRSERLSALAEECILYGEGAELMLSVLEDRADVEGVRLLVRSLKSFLERDGREPFSDGPP